MQFPDRGAHLGLKSFASSNIQPSSPATDGNVIKPSQQSLETGLSRAHTPTCITREEKRQGRRSCRNIANPISWLDGLLRINCRLQLWQSFGLPSPARNLVRNAPLGSLELSLLILDRRQFQWLNRNRPALSHPSPHLHRTPLQSRHDPGQNA